MDFLREDQCFIFLETGKRYQPYSFLLQSLWILHVTELFSCHYGVTGRDQIPKKDHPHTNSTKFTIKRVDIFYQFREKNTKLIL